MILRRWLASLMTRLRGGAAERELDEELRTHLEMAVEENLARGMSEREAAREARRQPGSRVLHQGSAAPSRQPVLARYAAAGPPLRNPHPVPVAPVLRRCRAHSGPRRRHDHRGVRHRGQPCC